MCQRMRLRMQEECKDERDKECKIFAGLALRSGGRRKFGIITANPPYIRKMNWIPAAGGSGLGAG